MTSIYDLPNDMYGEIMKFLDGYSVCNLYATSKIFWVLTDKQFQDYRILYKQKIKSILHEITPSKERFCNAYENYSKMKWLMPKLTGSVIFVILEKYSDFNMDTTKFSCMTGIHPESRIGIDDKSIYLRIWVRFRCSDPADYRSSETYKINILATELAIILAKV